MPCRVSHIDAGCHGGGYGKGARNGSGPQRQEPCQDSLVLAVFRDNTTAQTLRQREGGREGGRGEGEISPLTVRGIQGRDKKSTRL